ncbi:MAG: hypothetical protein JNM10_14555, partial [Planctomycetia bacterium]|nr:hypothetical protein [Planctomycetia bacterium]
MSPSESLAQPLSLLPTAPAGGPSPDEPAAVRAVEHGPDRLPSAELIALVLGRGTGLSPRAVARAERLVTTFGDVARVAVATPGELTFRGRLSPAEALRLAAAFALGRRGLERPWARGTPVRSAADVVDRYVARMRHLRHER